MKHDECGIKSVATLSIDTTTLIELEDGTPLKYDSLEPLSNTGIKLSQLIH